MKGTTKDAVAAIRSARLNGTVARLEQRYAEGGSGVSASDEAIILDARPLPGES